jgi:hypothetical protein
VAPPLLVRDDEIDTALGVIGEALATSLAATDEPA